MRSVGPQTVGVIVPMYNGAATIEETLASICAQTYSDLDVVVVNDGSTDHSPSIVRNWPDARVRMVTQANAGLAATRNNGAAATAAAYLAFVDADDIWRPRKIEAQMEAISREPDALVWCWFDEIDEKSKLIREPEMSSEESLQALCRWNIVGNGSSMLVSRRAFEESGGFDTTVRSVEDYAFALQVASRFPVRIVRERLLSYRVTPTNMSSNVRRLYDYLLIVLDKFSQANPSYKDDLDIHRRVAALAYYYRALGLQDYSTARFLYRELARYSALRPGLRRNYVRSRIKALLVRER